MAVAELAPGTRLGPTADGGFRYEVIRTLGAGGFGITYLAEDARLEGEVVVKELACHSTSFRDTASGNVRPIRGQRETHEKLVKRFLREARLLNRLRSPHIVRVTDVWEERGSAYYAMDKVEFERHLGETLTDGVTTRSWADAEVHAHQLLDALEAVHDAGLVHGDVKPANALVDKRTGVVLIDFGTARADEEFQATVTSTSFTRGYAPPELMHPSRVHEAGPWSDLYSWAMVVWELVMQHPSESGRPVDAAARRRGFDPYLDAAGQLAASGMPAEWATTLDACIRLEPSMRPRTVAAVRAMLRGEPMPTSEHLATTVASPFLDTPTPPGVARPKTASSSELAPLPTPIEPPPSPASTTPTRPATGPAWLIATAFAFLAIAGVGIAAARRAPPNPISEVVDGSSAQAEDEGFVSSTGASGANADGHFPGNDDCGGCDDGEVCVSNACHVEHAPDVMEKYRELLTAWNEGNHKAYFTQYNDPLACYHNRINFAIQSLRVLRGQHFAVRDGSRFEIESLTVLYSDEESVVLRDDGMFVAQDGREKPHIRLVEYRNFPNHGWRITTEVTEDSHGCADDWFE